MAMSVVARNRAMQALAGRTAVSASARRAMPARSFASTANAALSNSTPRSIEKQQQHQQQARTISTNSPKEQAAAATATKPATSR